MAVLSVDETAEGRWAAPDRPGDRPARLATVLHILTGPLPDDVVDGEVTVNMLFRGSLALNFLTGGTPDMTFSARCHFGGHMGRNLTRRMAWRTLGMTIDLACGVLRGECEHCAAAWANHLSRSAREER